MEFSGVLCPRAYGFESKSRWSPGERQLGDDDFIV
jgi:hypothetical protein